MFDQVAEHGGGAKGAVAESEKALDVFAAFVSHFLHAGISEGVNIGQAAEETDCVLVDFAEVGEGFEALV